MLGIKAGTFASSHVSETEHVLIARPLQPWRHSRSLSRNFHQRHGKLGKGRAHGKAVEGQPRGALTGTSHLTQRVSTVAPPQVQYFQFHYSQLQRCGMRVCMHACVAKAIDFHVNLNEYPGKMGVNKPRLPSFLAFPIPNTTHHELHKYAPRPTHTSHAPFCRHVNADVN